VFSSVGLGILLHEGIGDTMRVSLAADVVDEVKVAQKILQSLHLRSNYAARHRVPDVRAQSMIDLFAIAEEVERRTAHLRVPINIAVMGCAVAAPAKRPAPRSALPPATVRASSHQRQDRPQGEGRPDGHRIDEEIEARWGSGGAKWATLPPSGAGRRSATRSVSAHDHELLVEALPAHLQSAKINSGRHAVAGVIDSIPFVAHFSRIAQARRNRRHTPARHIEHRQVHVRTFGGARRSSCSRETGW
jgi:hypothetical protein